MIDLLLLLIDNYVHRLVQNKGDGKVVEIPGQEEVTIIVYCYCITNTVLHYTIHVHHKAC